jgi:hypothetical protein
MVAAQQSARLSDSFHLSRSASYLTYTFSFHEIESL